LALITVKGFKMKSQKVMAREVYAREFIAGYIEAAFWSSNDESGEPLDSGEFDISAQFRKQARADCVAFIRENLADLQAFADQYNSNPEYAGHYFWLTRNRHGAGFWDRGLEAGLSKRLTDSAHASGEVNLYVYRKKVFSQ
jgi:hypothetical protein